MTICLYECLRAAGLQHHYDGFTLVGVCHAAHLPALRMEDYPLLGVHSMEDRTRLFHLVQMVKTLDLKSLVNDDILIYKENVYDGGDEDCPAGDARFSSDGYGNPGEGLNKDQGENQTSMQSFSFARPSRAQRRLEFTVESSHPVHVCAKPNKNNLPVHGKESATSIQNKVFSRKLVLHGHGESQNDELDVLKRLHNCQNKEKLQIARGSSVFNYDVSLLPKSKTSHKHYPSPVTVPFKTFNSKWFGLKDRKRVSKRKSYLTGMTEPIPVYEAKRTAGYNYGLPLSSPHAPNNTHVGRQRISVCVRKRPLTRAEGRRGETDVVTTPGGDCVVVHESKEAVDLREYILQHRFYFDHVLGEESSNEEVYRKTTFPLVQHMLSGGKATCFAYGQTGAGKTYTMLGSSSGGPGLYALAAQDIFAHLSVTHSYYSPQLVYVSFFEIYCGQLYDLLDHRKRLFAREDGQKVVHISGLRNVRVDSVNSLLEVISQGTAERTQGTSGVNPRSSRSHALLQIQLRDLNLQTAGRMCFVDLAGSERASDAKEPDRQTRMEGAEINQSLLALKECIRSLDKEESHTPFRQSKLTQVLKDSFVGDSITCMIANISPGHQATEHTLNTLRYADRVKELRGQGEKKRCETRPSSKHNVSDSNKSQSNAGALMKRKLKKQSASFSPNTSAVRLHTEDAFLCSTPKNSRCGQKTQSGNRREMGFEQITPIRCWLANDGAEAWSERADEKEGRRMENVKYGSCNRVREKSTRAALVNEQRTKHHRNKDEATEARLAVAKVDSGLQLREKEMSQIITKRGRKEQMTCTETRGKTELLYRCRNNEGEEQRKGEMFKDDNKEKMKRLRQYHQQLQQFLPSSASSSVHLQSSSACPSFSSSIHDSLPSLLHSSCLSNLTQMDHNLIDFSNTDSVEVDCTTRQIPPLSARAFLQNESSVYCMKTDVDAHGSYGGVREDRKVGRCESERKRLETREERTSRETKRCSWVAEEESANRMTTNISSFCSWDSEDRGDLSVEELDASDAPGHGVWSIGQVEAADYSLQTAHSSNDSNNHFSQTRFESQHQRAPAERPLSPASENAIAAVMSDNLKDTCHKSNKQDCNILVLPFQNIPKAVSPNIASRRPFSRLQPVPATMTLTESPDNWPEHHVPTKSGSRQDFKAKMPILPQDESYLKSSPCTMDPLSFSLLHVNEQPATASFLQGHTSNGEDAKGEESLSSVEMERDTVEDGDAKFHLSLLEILHPSAPATSDVGGFALMSPCDQENSQKNKQTCHQTPLMSLPIHDSSFAVCKPPDHNVHKTQQLANVSGHLNIVHPNQSSTSKVSPKPSRTAEPRDQESNYLQIKPAIHLVTMDSFNNAKWCVVEAHLEQLKEVKALCHKEGKLLCQQHDMAFGEYVHKLAEILEKKAKCVHSMRAQLQPYLKSILPNHHPPTQEDNHHPVV